MRSSIAIREVGPREGLQSDPTILDTATKVRLLEMLLAAGVRSVNAVSFVHPRVMPQMADAEEVLESLGPRPQIISALAPNAKALDRAVAMKRRGLLDEVHFVHATTRAVLEANGISMPLDDHLEHVLGMARRATAEGLRTVVFVSAAFGCSVEGRVDPSVVVELSRRLVEQAEVADVAISDSTGQADPGQVDEMLGLLAPVFGSHPMTLHLHDSRGAGMANVLAAVRSSVPDLTLDTSFGGLGGDVPFLPEAAGNVATEDVCEMLHGMGIATGIDVPGVIAVSRLLHEATGRLILSRVFTVGPVRWKAVR